MSATGNETITVLSTAATSVTFSTPPILSAPLAAGTQICGIIVAPTVCALAAWASLDASKFVINPGSSGYAGYLTVGSTALAAGTYSVSVTATP